MIQFVADLRENQLALVYGQSRNHNEFCPSYFEGAYNPLIQRYFLGVFRFARMALADVRTLTYGSRNKILHRKHSTPIIEMAGTSQMLPGPAAGEVAAGLSSPRGSAASEH